MLNWHNPWLTWYARDTGLFSLKKTFPIVFIKGYSYAVECGPGVPPLSSVSSLGAFFQKILFIFSPTLLRTSRLLAIANRFKAKLSSIAFKALHLLAFQFFAYSSLCRPHSPRSKTAYLLLSRPLHLCLLWGITHLYLGHLGTLTPIPTVSLFQNPFYP